MYCVCVCDSFRGYKFKRCLIKSEVEIQYMLLSYGLEAYYLMKSLARNLQKVIGIEIHF